MSDRDPEPELSPDQVRQASAIARQTMSPFCPGRTLADCPSEFATEWRRDIRQMIAEGRSPAEVQAELERRAGANLSGSPARDTSYWVPAAFALLGVGALAAIFVRLRRAAPERPTQGPPAGEAGSDRDPQSSDTAPSAAQSAGTALPTNTAQPVDDARLEAELAAEGDEDR